GELAPYRLMTKASDRCVGFPATRWRGEDQTLCVVLFVIKEGAHGRQRGRGARGLESCVDVTLGDPPPLREGLPHPPLGFFAVPRTHRVRIHVGQHEGVRGTVLPLPGNETPLLGQQAAS